MKQDACPNDFGGRQNRGRLCRYCFQSAYFNQNFVKTGIFAKEASKIIKGASIMREQSEYSDFFIALRQDAEEQIERAKEFIGEVMRYLQNKQVL